MYTDKVKRVRQALSRFDYVHFTFCDINGVSRGKMQPVRNADDFQKGLTIFVGKTMCAHIHVIYVPSVKNQYKRVVFGYNDGYLLTAICVSLL